MTYLCYIGKEKANKFVDAHETGDSGANREMDNANNDVGLEVGDKSGGKSNSQLLTTIFELAKNGGKVKPIKMNSKQLEIIEAYIEETRISEEKFKYLKDEIR